MTENDTILIVAEAGTSGLRPSSLELIAAAKALGGNVTGLLFGADLGDPAAILAGAGVDQALVVDRPELATPSAEAATSIIAAAVERLAPAAVLMLNTTLATEYAPAVAARLGKPLVSDVFALRVETGQIVATHPVLGGRLQQDATFSGAGPVLIAVRAGAFGRAATGGGSAPIETLSVELGDLDQRVKVISVAAKETGGVGLDTAEIVVAGGRGLKDAASFKLIEELASALGGAVGATRAVTDLGWRPHNEQIGQTGKTVTPKLYIAAGISGAVQHTVGMTGSENIVVVNRDPDAPIFKNASFGIVGDLFEVLPALTAAIVAARS